MSMQRVQKESALGCDEVVERLKAAVLAHSMGVVSHINGQANAAKRGLSVGCDQILEVFRPDFATRVWAAHKAAGIDIPLRFHVYEADGKTILAYRLPSEVFRTYNNTELNRLGNELDPIFAAIFEDTLSA